MDFQLVVDFIKHFAGAEKTFLRGCCYWFAWILQCRFGSIHDDGCFSEIFYEPVEGHFIFGIHEDSGWHYFDVRGDVTSLYNKDGVTLRSISDIIFNDPKWYERLMRDCRNFITPEDL